MSQLDRIEQKLDRLLTLMGKPPAPPNESDEMLTVLKTGGVDKLKEFVRNGGKAA